MWPSYNRREFVVPTTSSYTFFRFAVAVTIVVKGRTCNKGKEETVDGRTVVNHALGLALEKCLPMRKRATRTYRRWALPKGGKARRLMIRSYRQSSVLGANSAIGAYAGSMHDISPPMCTAGR